MITTLARGCALAVLAATIACTGSGDDDVPTGDTADAARPTPDASADSLTPRALGSLEGSCPVDATIRTGSRGRYENELERGEFLLLRANGEVIDSIDARFGAHVVGDDSVVFIPIYTDTTGSFPFTSTIGEPILCAAGERVLLRRLLPGLDPLFSSPAIRDSTIFYWGLRPLTEPGSYFLTARRYHFPSARADSLALSELAMYTDDRYHLRQPRFVRDSIIYETEGNRWTWSIAAAPADTSTSPP